MKQTFYSIFAALMILLVSGCKKEGVALFDDETASNNIYFYGTSVTTAGAFGSGGVVLPTNLNSFSFGFLPASKKDTILQLPIQATGSIRNVDRPYVLSIADSSTMVKGIHYDILNTKLAIKAGKTQDTIRVKVYRNAQFQTKPYRLYLSLKPNENFTTVLSTLVETKTAGGMINYSISADDIAGKPTFWDASYCDYFWGPYSLKKLNLYVQVCNLDVNALTKPNFVLGYTLMRAYARVIRTYLLDMQGKGTPVLEADGTPMIMGPVI